VSRKGREVAASGTDLIVSGVLVSLHDAFEVVFRLSRGEEGVFHLLGDDTFSGFGFFDCGDAFDVGGGGRGGFVFNDDLGNEAELYK